MSSALKLVVEKVRLSDAPTRQRSLRLTLVGNDRPGIIKEISRALALQHVNVEELATQCTAAPMSGESLFNAQAELKVPADLDVRAVDDDFFDHAEIDDAAMQLGVLDRA